MSSNLGLLLQSTDSHTNHSSTVTFFPLCFCGILKAFGLQSFKMQIILREHIFLLLSVDIMGKKTSEQFIVSRGYKGDTGYRRGLREAKRAKNKECVCMCVFKFGENGRSQFQKEIKKRFFLLLLFLHSTT